MKGCHILVAMACLVNSGCSFLVDSALQPYHPKPRRDYGNASLPVAVSVGSGFKRPGMYYLPTGSTLKTVITQAHLWREIAGQGLPNRYCYLQITQVENGHKVTFKSNGQPTEQELDQVLTDGAVVEVVHLVKWTL